MCVAVELFAITRNVCLNGYQSRNGDVSSSYQINVHPKTAVRDQRRSKNIGLLFKTSALDGGGWLTSRPGRFTPATETRYSLVGWAPGLISTGAEYLASTGFEHFRLINSFF